MTFQMPDAGAVAVDTQGRNADRSHEAAYRVLVVDDEAGIRNSLASYLEHAGYTVDAAEDALVARRLMDEKRYDLVFSDISMPEVSGLELLAEIKAAHEEVEVIMITAYLDISLAIQAMRRGAFDFFTKPFNYEKILLTIQRVREKQELRERARQYDLLKRKREFENQAILETTLGLARAVEERDRYNLGHGKRTARFAEMIARELGFEEERLRLLRFAGLLHDVGKIGISDKVLNKPGRLNEEEFEAIKRHPEIGEYILKPISFLKNISRIVRHHHERWDGRGYPDGLSGEEIPLESRILTVSDIFDSVTSARPYRRPMPLPDALQLIRDETGRALDPKLADIFSDLMVSSPVSAGNGQQRS